MISPGVFLYFFFLIYNRVNMKNHACFIIHIQSYSRTNFLFEYMNFLKIIH